RPLRCSSAAPGIRKAKAPTKGLSTLNSMAFGLAVYASQCGLPTPHARLASSRWSDSTGRAFHPQGSDERFQSVTYISYSSPKLAWRNRIDRSQLNSFGVVGPKQAERHPVRENWCGNWSARERAPTRFKSDCPELAGARLPQAICVPQILLVSTQARC